MNDSIALKLLFFPALILGLLLLSCLPTFLVALWEKHMVWPYVPIAEPDAAETHPLLDDGNPYTVGHSFQTKTPPLVATAEAARSNQAAEALGFDYLGRFRDGKGKIYRVLYDIWISPDLQILAIIGGGAILGIPLRAVWLVSRRQDGHRLVGINEQSASFTDLSGLTTEKLVAGADFLLLHERQRQWIARSPVPVVPHSDDDPLGDHFDYRARRTDLIVARGFARYLDAERDRYRFGVRGALTWTLAAMFKGYRRKIWPDSWLGFSRPRS